MISRTRFDIIRTLDALMPKTGSEVAMLTGINYSLTMKTLRRMERDGQVKRVFRGEYVLAGQTKKAPLGALNGL